jgi:hypothetical protein
VLRHLNGTIESCLVKEVNVAEDTRSPWEQIKDLGGLVTGKKVVRDNRIEDKNPPQPSPESDVEVDVTIRDRD